jgi:hypothetical protein
MLVSVYLSIYNMKISAEQNTTSRAAADSRVAVLNTTQQTAQFPAPIQSVSQLMSSGTVQFVKKTYKSIESSGYKTYIIYDTDTKLIESVLTERSSYSGSLPTTKRGDHTTAIVVFRDMIIRAGFKKTLNECKEQLRYIITVTMGLPGMQKPGAQKNLRPYFVGLLDEVNNMTIDEVPSVMDKIITARNFVPLTSFTHSKSTGGFGESASAGGLFDGNRYYEKKGDTSYTLQNGDKYNIWKLLDIRKKPSGYSVNTMAAIIQQHLMTLRIAYPWMIGPKDLTGLIDWASINYWSEYQGTVFSGFEADELAIVALAKKQINAKKSVALVVSPGDDFEEDFDDAADIVF